ncbi:hypothetical protein [Cylindrospermum sp. FACHB-282]|uniref:hypothetical protein n=1 Tax=Cylindrospermum sp. FACHB-282 TaxID=2692794 RepID=UPI001689C5C7|nr:hypothetical protein [Cylindrospermum sp. FACHB-282]MBD2387209.1 hypothetical protein [Cylindrospermum sp. FACHB-282]
MMFNNISKLQLRQLFFFGLVALYLGIFFFSNKLQFAPVWDEKHFWGTSLLFSKSLIPDLGLLRNYPELNTPLPFIIFGTLEHLFHGGLFVGRLLNLLLSFVIICLVGFSGISKSQSGFIAASGILLSPYYLFHSIVLYTDIIAIFFVVFGFWFYIRSQHILSCLAFILAIASRQYMLAFPLAIAAYELSCSWKTGFKLRIQLLAPIVASSSIFGWIWLFGGLAPQSGLGTEVTPEIQQLVWAFSINGSLYFLAWVGLNFVVPEWVLLSRKINQRQIFIPKNCCLALGILLLFIISFHSFESHGILKNATELLPSDFLKFVVFYCLALLACVRFSRINLAFWVILMNCGIMLKAYPWEKYVLPLIVVFWYFQSINLLDNTPKDGVAKTKT